MRQYMSFMRSKSGQATAFGDWYLLELAPRLLDSSEVKHLVVNVAVDPPAGLQLYNNEAKAGDGYDVVSQVWCESQEDFEATLAPHAAQLAEWLDINYCYEMSETVEVDHPERLAGNPAPGYKIMRGIFFHDDMPDSAVKRSWAHHANLAKKVHLALARYVRFWVEKIVTPGSPPIRGATNLQFATPEDVTERYFVSPEGREQIEHDIGHFIAGGLVRVFTREYVLR